jgi:hypothetical protein
MAGKQYYTADEAAQRLNKSVAEVNSLADKGLLQRVNHENMTKFRVDQVDLMADENDGPLGLADSQPLGLADSGPATPAPKRGAAASNPLEDSVLGLADSGPANARTGISAVSGRGKGSDAVEIGLETVGSGSGLLDLTRESEETALGAELIEQVYKQDGGDTGAGATGLFSAVTDSGMSASASPDVVSPSFAMVQESYDGSWSGVGIGLMVAAFAGLVVVALIAMSVAAGAGSSVASSMAGNMAMWAGILAGVTAVFGVVGFFVGRATE